jgi:hypothetical protein
MSLDLTTKYNLYSPSSIVVPNDKIYHKKNYSTAKINLNFINKNLLFISPRNYVSRKKDKIC